MICSRNMRKPIHKSFFRALILGLIVGLLYGLTGGFTIGKIMAAAPKPNVVSSPRKVQDIENLFSKTQPNLLSERLGEYRVTAYCSCEKCCGKWALNRPKGIVYGAAGVELKAGVSVASTLPFGTVVEIEGLGEYTVQDHPAQWVVKKYGENIIDIYFDDHEAACAFGLKNLNVYLKEKP